MTIRRSRQQGVTLVELLITMVVLMLILGGVYGLMGSAHDIFLKTRAFSEAQQTSRVVLNYLVFRLREIDGGGSGGITPDPRDCTLCHIPEIDKKPYNSSNPSTNDANIPCTLDVLVPRPNLYFENISTDSNGVPFLREVIPLVDLPNITSFYKNLPGASQITFWADLLPEHGLSDTYVETDGDGIWDLIRDVNGNLRYDAKDEDREMLFYDYNGNGKFDYYGEKWSFRLKTTTGGKFFQLLESLVFQTYTAHNKSVYRHDTSGVAYIDAPVAFGVTGLGIQIIPKYARYQDLQAELGTAALKGRAAAGPTSCDRRTGCHVSDATGKGPFVNDPTSTPRMLLFDTFSRYHPWWNIKGISIEVGTTDLTTKEFIRVKQYVIPRNLEVNSK